MRKLDYEFAQIVDSPFQLYAISLESVNFVIIDLSDGYFPSLLVQVCVFDLQIVEIGLFIVQVELLELAFFPLSNSFVDEVVSRSFTLEEAFVFLFAESGFFIMDYDTFD